MYINSSLLLPESSADRLGTSDWVDRVRGSATAKERSPLHVESATTEWYGGGVPLIPRDEDERGRLLSDERGGSGGGAGRLITELVFSSIVFVVNNATVD